MNRRQRLVAVDMVLRRTLLIGLLVYVAGFAFFLGDALSTPQYPGALAIFAAFATWALAAGGGLSIVALAWWTDRKSPSRGPPTRQRRTGGALAMSIALMILSFGIFVALVTIPCPPACVGGGGVAGGGAGGNAVAGPSCGGGCDKAPVFVASLAAEVLSITLLALVTRAIWDGSAPGLSTGRLRMGKDSGALSELHDRS